MNKFHRLVLGIVLAGQSILQAAPQVVTGSTITELDSNGSADGVAFQGQAAASSTLFVPINMTVNTNTNLVGISTDSFAKGTVLFEGNGRVRGSTGIAFGNPLLSIELGLEDVVFNGDVSSQNFKLGSHILTINGNLTLPTGATLYTKVLSDDVFGNINLNDFAVDTINASSVAINVDASDALDLTNGQIFNIVFAQTGTSGVPITVTGNNVRYAFTTNPAGPNANVSDNGILAIVSNLVPIPSLVKNPNAQSVGAVLDATLPVAGAYPDSDFAFVQTQLGLPTTGALEDALLQISAASGLVGVSRESFNIARQFQRLVLEHLHYDTTACEGVKLWGDGFVYMGHQNDRKYYNGYNAHTWGTMIGLEAPFTYDLRGGIGFGYAYSDIDDRGFRDGTSIHSYQGTGYLGYHIDNWFMDGGLSFGWNRYDGERRIHYREVNRTARAEYNGFEYTGYFVTGFQQCCGDWTVTPLGSVIYSYLHLGKYKERGANALNLYVKAQDYQFLQSALGVKASRQFETCYGSFIPEIHTFWLHDYNTCTLDAKASFLGLGGAGGNFWNRGPRFDQNTWNIGASVTVFATEQLSLLGLYDYEVSDHYYSHQGTLEFEWNF